MRHEIARRDAGSASAVSRCPDCGNENFAFASFCIACGEPLERGRGDFLPGAHPTAPSLEQEKPGSDEIPERAATPQARKVLRWESFAGLALLLCTLGYSLFNWHQMSVQADAYHQGIAAEEKRDWDSALSSFRNAGSMRDASRLADQARRNVEERDELYNRAVAAASRQEWGTVLSSLAAVQEIQPGYKDSVQRIERARAEAFRSGLDGLVYLVSDGPASGLYVRAGNGRTLLLPGSDKNSTVRAISPGDTVFVYDAVATRSDDRPRQESGPGKAGRVPVLARLDPSGALATFPLPNLDGRGQGVFAGTGLWWLSAQPGKEFFGYDAYYVPDYTDPMAGATRISDVLNGKRVVALDPPRSRAIIAESSDDGPGGSRQTRIYLRAPSGTADPGGSITRLLHEVQGNVVQASVSDDGRRLLYVSQTGSYPISRTVWVAALDAGTESMETHPPRQLAVLSWSGLEMNVRLTAAFLPQVGKPGIQLPRVIVDRVLGDTETLTVHDLGEFSATLVWQGAPDGVYGRSMSGLSHDGRYLASRRQLGRRGRLEIVGLQPEPGRKVWSGADLRTYPGQIVKVQFAPRDDYAITTARNPDGISRGIAQDVFSARVGPGGALNGQPRRIALANLPYVQDYSPVALPPAGYVLAYVTTGGELHAVFLDGSGDTMIAQRVSAVWALKSSTNLSWWR